MAFSGPAHVTASTMVFSWDCARRAVRSYDKILQPPSLSSKDVERFRVAASQPQVTITGQ